MIEPSPEREQRIIAAMKLAYAKSIDEHKQFLRLAIELCEHYNFTIKDIEKLTGAKL